MAGGSRSGVVELDRAIDSIHVGHRHRQDLGDLDELVESIRRLGMLQPITISPDGTLLCGARRLEAARRLGLRQVNVWVRSGVSGALEALLAEQHENTKRKPYSPREAAALYRELKTLIAEDAQRRQQTTQFGSSSDTPNSDQETAGRVGYAKLAAPSDRTARAQAAQLVTGRNSYTTLERIGRLEQLATDPTAPAEIRDLAANELVDLDADGRVHGRYRRIMAARQVSTRNPARPSDRRLRGVRSFWLTWEALAGWTDQYDPTVIGPALTEEQWTTFLRTVRATTAFTETARAARTLHTNDPQTDIADVNRPSEGR